jgi:hypothetical protein
MFVDKEGNVIAYSGSEICLMSERRYEDLTVGVLSIMEMSTDGAILMTAMETRSRRIKKQILLRFILGNTIWTEFLDCSQLAGPFIWVQTSLVNLGFHSILRNNAFIMNWGTDGEIPL